MTYETAGASSANDLIDKLRIFAENNGWTTDYSGASAAAGSNNSAPGAGSTAVLLHKGGICAGFFTDTKLRTVDDPGQFIGTTHYPGPYNPAQAPAAQSGMSSIFWTNNISGPYQAYHFFADDNYLHAVVEVTPGSFRHFGVGQLEKAGALTTGAYAHGIRWRFTVSQGWINNFLLSYHTIPFDDGALSTFHNDVQGTMIKADSDAISPRNIEIMDYSAGGGSGWGGFRGQTSREHEDAPLSGLMRLPPSELTGRAVLFPCLMAVHRPSGMLTLLGSPRDVRWTRIDNLAPGDIITIGADNWKVFPIIRKNGPSGQENSENYGLAYRVVS